MFSDLHHRYGPLVGGSDLASALGFKSTAAFRQALRRGTVPIAVFEPPRRKGKFALNRDLSNWIETIKPVDREY